MLNNQSRKVIRPGGVLRFTLQEIRRNASAMHIRLRTAGLRGMRIGLVCAGPIGRVKMPLGSGKNDQGRPLGVRLPAIRHRIDSTAARAIQLVPECPAKLAAHECLLGANRVRGSSLDEHRAAGIQGFGRGFIGMRPGGPSGRLCHALAFHGERTSLATGPDSRRGTEHSVRQGDGSVRCRNVDRSFARPAVSA